MTDSHQSNIRLLSPETHCSHHTWSSDLASTLETPSQNLIGFNGSCFLIGITAEATVPDSHRFPINMTMQLFSSLSLYLEEKILSIPR